MNEVKIGLVGLGWGKNHIKAYAAVGGARVVAIADDAAVVRGENKPVGEYVAALGAKHYIDGVRMIEETDIDAVDLAVAPKWREPLLRAAAKRGLPVLMEKPMANNLPQAERFAKIARDAGIPLMMEYPLRFHPAMQRARQLLGDGPLGAPLSVTAELQTSWNPPAGHWCWAVDVEGGVVTECGCHLIDTVCFLCGKPERVFAMGRSVRGHGQTVDTAALTIEFENGCCAVLNEGGLGTMGFNTPMYVKVYADKGEILVAGEDWVYHDVAWAPAGRGEPMRRERLEGPPRLELLRQNLIEFIRVARGEMAPPCSAEDGLIVQRVIAAMVQSIQSGRAERVS